ncbi:hypothetical protein [Azospirillum brasilense]|uniref:hypothetical protein n=1 Tax=Azospirillum brasilense TaxID=192 RepID=UPI0018CB0689|nr:hypothetical protein [Azospirillum brasilense]
MAEFPHRSAPVTQRIQRRRAVEADARILRQQSHRPLQKRCGLRTPPGVAVGPRHDLEQKGGASRGAMVAGHQPRRALQRRNRRFAQMGAAMGQGVAEAVPALRRVGGQRQGAAMGGGGPFRLPRGVEDVGEIGGIIRRIGAQRHGLADQRRGLFRAPGLSTQQMAGVGLLGVQNLRLRQPPVHVVVERGGEGFGYGRQGGPPVSMGRAGQMAFSPIAAPPSTVRRKVTPRNPRG